MVNNYFESVVKPSLQKHCELLGVDSKGLDADAFVKATKEAWKTLSFILHPDKSKAKTQEEFKAITNSRNVIIKHCSTNTSASRVKDPAQNILESIKKIVAAKARADQEAKDREEAAKAEQDIKDQEEKTARSKAEQNRKSQEEAAAKAKAEQDKNTQENAAKVLTDYNQLEAYKLGVSLKGAKGIDSYRKLEALKVLLAREGVDKESAAKEAAKFTASILHKYPINRGSPEFEALKTGLSVEQAMKVDTDTKYSCVKDHVSDFDYMSSVCGVSFDHHDEL